MFFGNQVVLFDVGTLGVVMHYGGTHHGNKAKIIFLRFSFALVICCKT